MSNFIPITDDKHALITNITREFVEHILSNDDDYSRYDRVYGVIGDSVESIGDGAFCIEASSPTNYIPDKIGIQSFPESVKTIGNSAFLNSNVCKDADLTFDLSSDEGYDIWYDLWHEIGNHTFNNATVRNLTINNIYQLRLHDIQAFNGLTGDSLNLNDVEYIYNDVNDTSLKQFSAPKLKYASNILSNCQNLSNIIFQNDIAELEHSIISCPNLSSLTLRLTDIYSSVSSCISLERIDIIGIPNDSYVYADKSFNNNNNLVSAFYCSPDDTQLEINSSFRNCPKLSPDSSIFEYATIIENSSFSDSITDEAYELSCIDLPNIRKLWADCFKNSMIREFRFGNKLESIPLLSTSATTFSFPNSTCCHVATLENYEQITSNGIDVIAGKTDPWGTLDYAGRTLNNSLLRSAVSNINCRPTQLSILYLPFISSIAIDPNPDYNNGYEYTYDGIILSSVTTIHIDDGKKYNWDSQLSIGKSAFGGMPNLRALTVKSPKEHIYISDYAFNGLKKLTTVEFPSYVYSLTIGDSAFQNCSNLTSINDILQASHPTVGNNAFAGCDRLTQLYISNSDQIGDYAFSNCKNLLQAYLSYPTNVGSGAFAYCDKLKSLQLTQYSSYKQVTLGDGITRGCNELTSIQLPSSSKYKLSNDMIIDMTENSVKAAMKSATSIPNGITRIKPYAFGDMHNTTIACPSSVTTIDEHAFDGCSELLSFSLQNSNISSVGDYAFNNCKNIRSISNIANNCKTIGSHAFDGCITADDELDLRELTGHSEYMFADSGVTSLKLTNLINSNYAFANMHKLFRVDFQNGQTITNIPYGTFEDDDKLRILTNCDNITSLGAYAFQGCELLLSVDFNQVKTIPNYCFDGCSSLTAANCINTADYIGDYAFRGSGITEVITNADTIEYGAFENCPYLGSVNIGKDVQNIYHNIFAYSRNIRSFNVDSRNPKYYANSDGLFDINGELMFMTSGIDSYILTGNIYQYAFTTNGNLTSLMISTDQDYYITPPVLPHSIEHLSCVGTHSYWTNDRGDCLLDNNNTLIKGTINTIIPPYVKSINTDAFYGLAITDINFDSPYLTAYSGEFNNCHMLSSITFGKQLLEIRDDAFYSINCNSLHHLDFSKTRLSSIGGDAFSENRITQIILPSTCQTIDDTAFCDPNSNQYSSLTSLQFDMPAAEISTIPGYPWGLSPRIITSTDRFKSTLKLGQSIGKQTLVDPAGILYYDENIGGPAVNCPSSSSQLISICNCTFDYSISETYTGDHICPSITVHYDGVDLSDDIDYIIEYLDNIEPGFAKINVSGKGRFNDHRTLYFTIHQ